MNLKYTRLNQMNTGDVLDYTIEVYKRNFKQITLICLMMYTPFVVLITMVTNFFSADLMNFVNFEGGNDLENMEGIPYMLLSFYIALFVVGIFYIIYWISLKGVMDASIIKVIYNDIIYSKKLNTFETIKACFKDFTKILINKILYGLIISGVYMGAYIGFVVLLLAGVFIAAFQFGDVFAGGDLLFSQTWTIILGIILGLLFLAAILAFIIVVVYFTAKFSMGVAAITIEGKNGVEAVGRCNVLGKKSFWHITLTFAFGMILIYGVPTILNYIPVGLQFVYKDNYKLIMLISGSTQVIFSLVSPFVTTLVTLLFINLKIRNEGFDLELKVDEMLETAAEGEVNEE